VEIVDDDGLYDSDGFQYDAPRIDPAGELLTLALLEDLSNLLVVHGYQPLRGYALAEMAGALHRLRNYSR
jgi:hypothetical protein